MSNDVHIKRLDLSEKAVLLAFLRAAYPDDARHGDERFWDWHFLENPHAEDIPVWVAKSGERIVGQLAAIPVELATGAEQGRAMWILDFVVDENFRRRGIGKRLVAAAQESCPVGLGVNTDEQHAPALLQGMGWVKVGNIHRYNRLLFPGDALREIAQWRVLRRLLNICYAPFRPRFAGQATGAGRTMRQVEGFDSSFDALWRDARAQWSCAVVRDARMLEWQYARQPGKRFDVLGLYEGERLAGYVVLFFRKKDAHGALPKAAITDLCYRPDNSAEVVDELLRGALRLAVERRAGALVTDVLDPLVEERLRRLGFWRIKKSPQLMVKAADRQGLLYKSSNWFLTRGDSDISIFEQPNFLKSDR